MTERWKQPFTHVARASHRGRAAYGLCGVLLCLLGLLAAPTVYAHAELVTADPGPGEVVDGSLETIWLEFSEPLRPGSDLVLFGTGFRAVEGVQVALDLTQPTRLVAMLPALAPDNYTVQWTSVSIDGDSLTGSYAFGIRSASNTARPLLNFLLALFIFLAVVTAILALRQRSAHAR